MLPTRSRVLVLVLAASAAFALPAPSAHATAPVHPADAPACPQLAEVQATGPACRMPNGLLAVYSAAGEFLGFTHGPDPVFAEAPGGLGILAARNPTCVADTVGTKRIVVVYARAANDADRYSTMKSSIQSAVKNANGMVYDAAVATSDDGDLKVACSGGAIIVKNAVLPTPHGSSSFSTIKTDLTALGYSDPKAKYWVYYDEDICTCSGQGNVYYDTDPSEANLNNGNAASTMIAVSYATTSTRTWLHEIAHTMGAVQHSAPRSTGAGHCNDGLDTMCYDDGGPGSGSCTSFYCPGRCSTEIFDCGKDTYFDATPSSTEWLASNWNLGSRNNHYIQMHRPLVELVNCPETVWKGLSTACTFRASDDSATVRFVITWGDGTSTTTGYGAPGVDRTYSHTWNTAGAVTVSATAYDGALDSVNSKGDAISIVADTAAPVITLVDPATGSLYSGCAVKVPYAGARPAYLAQGCAKATVTDALSGVASVKLFFGGTLVSTLTSPNGGGNSYVFEWTTGDAASNVQVKLEARDLLGNLATRTVNVDVLVT